jgi:hypothetical protein
VREHRAQARVSSRSSARSDPGASQHPRIHRLEAIRAHRSILAFIGSKRSTAIAMVSQHLWLSRIEASLFIERVALGLISVWFKRYRECPPSHRFAEAAQTSKRDASRAQARHTSGAAANVFGVERGTG